MQISSYLAVLGYFLVVPGCIWAAYAGSNAGLYPGSLVPIVFGVLFVVVTSLLLVAVSTLRAREGDYAPARES